MTNFEEVENIGGFGERITLKEADEMIGEYSKIQNITEKKIKDSVVNYSSSSEFDNQIQRAQTLILEEKNKNAFLFERELVDRFFNGSENEKADYLLVVLGAHPCEKIVNDVKFNAGSPTVLVVGCNRDKDNPNVFHPLNIKEVASEWPPATKLVTLQTIELPGDDGEPQKQQVFVL